MKQHISRRPVFTTYTYTMHIHTLTVGGNRGGRRSGSSCREVRGCRPGALAQAATVVVLLLRLGVHAHHPIGHQLGINIS